MKKDFFYRTGELIYKLRWLIMIGWLSLLIACIPFLPHLMEPFKAIGFTDPHSESAQTNDILNNKLGFSYNRFIILYDHDELHATDTKFQQQIKNSLKGLKNFSIENQIIFPTINNKQISKDQHTAYAVVLFKSDQEVDEETLKEFKSSIKTPPDLKMHIGGEPIFLEDTKIQTQTDLHKAEYITTPIAIITMLIVFGSVVAASLPVILGGVGAIFILTALYFIGKYISLSVFTINIALLLGLCLSLDYALLIVNRYREELRAGRPLIDAISITLTTAGKSVFFSGLAVLVSLSALLLFPINVLFSVGIGGVIAVMVSILVAIILLPAVLSTLNHKIDFLKIRFLSTRRQHSIWGKIASKVVKKPLLYFVIVLTFLLILAYPFLHAKFGFSDFRILPKSQESRQVFESFKNKFGENKLSPILAVVSSTNKNILNKKDINALYDFTKNLKADSRVEDVFSIVSTKPSMNKSQYASLYTAQKDYLPKPLKEYLQTSTRDNMTLMTIISRSTDADSETKALINDLRKNKITDNLTIQLTGTNVNSVDALKSISSKFPTAFIWIIVFTFIVLLFLLNSLFLPIKAILTAILSLLVSYGVLTLIIQDGYLHTLLNFEPQGILDISLLIIIFCALFGISMDYEVFLLTRIKEYYEHTNDNIKSIVQGIDRSGRIISSAAIIVVLICFSFMSADILIVKAFGLGIAIAVFVDAFIIRVILVPATMALLGKWNWYLPGFLSKGLPKITFDPE